MKTFPFTFWVRGRYLMTVSALHGEAALQGAIDWQLDQPTGELGNAHGNLLFCRQRLPDGGFKKLRVFVDDEGLPHVQVPRKMPTEPQTFDMLFVVDGTYSVQVNAETEDDAQKKAEQLVQSADFGFLRSKGVEFSYGLADDSGGA